MGNTSELRHLVGRLRMRHLEFLHWLGQDPNLGRTAKRLNMSQPTASKLLLELEEILAARLFDRNRRGLTPTAAGIAITRRAGVMLEELHAAHLELLGTLSGGGVQRLRLGVFPVAVPELLSRLYAKLQQDSPGMCVSIEEGNEASLLTALSEGRIDCLVGRIVAELLTPDLQHVVLYQEPTVVVCGSRHPLARCKKSERAVHLAQSDWLLPKVGGAVHKMVASSLALQGLPAPRVLVESISIFVTLEMLNHSELLAVFPLTVAQAYAKLGKLAIVPLDIPAAAVYPVGIVSRRSGGNVELVKAVVSCAQEIVASGQLPGVPGTLPPLPKGRRRPQR